MSLKKAIAGAMIIAGLTIPAYSQAKSTGAIALEEKVETGTKWFSKGDMYRFRKSKAPLEVYICNDKSKSRSEDYYKLFSEEDVDTSRLTDDYIKKWVSQTNEYLSYLSNGKFQLDLKEIKRINTDYWNTKEKDAELPYPDKKSFKMIVHPSATKGGHYSMDGFFWVNPFYLQTGEDYDSLPIHEMMHGFFGEGHSESKNSTINTVSMIGLTEKEAKHLGWNYVKPIDIHPKRRSIFISSNGKERVERYRD